MRVLVTRPREDTKRVALDLATKGIDVVAAPLLDIIYQESSVASENPMDLSGVQALLFTSVNGVRAYAKTSNPMLLPALCVGDATAREAHRVGFITVKSADGDVHALAKLVQDETDPKSGVLLHLAGTNIAGNLAKELTLAGYSYRRAVLYTAKKALVLPETARLALASHQIDGVLLYSPRTGATFAKLVREAKLDGDLSTVTAYCLSHRVADVIANLPWKTIKIAPKTEQSALLALLKGSSRHTMP